MDKISFLVNIKKTHWPSLQVSIQNHRNNSPRVSRTVYRKKPVCNNRKMISLGLLYSIEGWRHLRKSIISSGREYCFFINFRFLGTIFVSCRYIEKSPTSSYFLYRIYEKYRTKGIYRYQLLETAVYSRTSRTDCCQVDDVFWLDMLYHSLYFCLWWQVTRIYFHSGYQSIIFVYSRIYLMCSKIKQSLYKTRPYISSGSGDEYTTWKIDHMEWRFQTLYEL